MAKRSEIESLAEHRQRLLAESDRLRQQVAEDIDHLEPLFGWVDRGYAVARSVIRAWPLVAGAAGFLIARKRRGPASTLTRILSWWKMGLKAYGLWKAFSSRSPGPQQAPEPRPVA
jgi:hypothetical protein